MRVIGKKKERERRRRKKVCEGKSYISIDSCYIYAASYITWYKQKKEKER